MPGAVLVTEGPPEKLRDTVLQLCQQYQFRIEQLGEYRYSAKKGSLIAFLYLSPLASYTDEFDYVNFTLEIAEGDEGTWELSLTWKSPKWWAGKVAANKIRNQAKILGDAVGSALRQQGVKIRFVQQL